MTQTEYEDKEYELKMYISDKFRDIQMQANSLKNVEDITKTKQTLTKISDFIQEIHRGYSSLESLYHEDITDEQDDNDDFNGDLNLTQF